MKREKEPLYRKVNSTAHGCHHDKGGDYSDTRHSTKQNTKVKMKQGVARGLDYTPLFKFLLSKVGQDFDAVYSEAVSRLDKKDPISWMVVSDLSLETFRNENSFFNTLYVDEQNILQKVNPNLTVNDITPQCNCCTYTLNGKVIPKK